MVAKFKMAARRPKNTITLTLNGLFLLKIGTQIAFFKLNQSRYRTTEKNFKMVVKLKMATGGPKKRY